MQICRRIKDYTDNNYFNFFTTHARPKFAKDVTTFSDEIKEILSLAIIIQGPIKKEYNFTFETIKIYKKHFKNALIILSTWADENTNGGGGVDGIEIVKSKKPAYCGISNINLQIESSKNGIMRAKELGFEYAIKTRTDQRMYAPNIQEFLFNILNNFPLEDNIQKQRLIGVSLDTFKYRLYGVGDMFMFGHIDDMLLYWSPEYDNRKWEDLNEKYRKSILDYCECRLVEIYLATEFLKKIGRKFDFTLKDSWEVYANHFVFIDKESLDLYWPKRTNKEHRWLKYQPHHLEELTFKEWFNLYQGLGNKIVKCIPSF